MHLRSGKSFSAVSVKSEWISVKKEMIKAEPTPEIKREVKRELEREISEKPVKAEQIRIKRVKQEPGIETNEPPVIKPPKLYDENNKPYWELGRDRRLLVSTFEGVEYVHIREFYTEDRTGRRKPGKKGITLMKSEWEKLISVHKDVEFSQPDDSGYQQ